ncbi:MAG: protease inhibitor I42 family protein, partial [Acidimicrobiales bacterium]
APGTGARPGQPPPAPEPTGPVVHPPEAITARCGQTFELVLATTPRPAHIWQGTLPPALRIVSEGFAPDPPPRHVVRLEAVAAGRNELTFVYAIPWDPTPVETRTVVVTVEE